MSETNRYINFEIYRFAWRGFSPFYKDLLEHINGFKCINALCEIGISTGDKQIMWGEIYPMAKIIGIDILDPINSDPTQEPYCNMVDSVQVYKRRLEWQQLAFEKLKKLSVDNISYYHGFDGYSKDTANMISNIYGKIDILIDDAAIDWPEMRDAFPTWKDIIIADGIFISESPDGNGTPKYAAIDKEVHLERMQWLAKHTNQVVFDFKEFAFFPSKDIAPPSHNPWTIEGNYLSIGCHDYSYYMPVIKKYEKYIVAGYENLIN